MNDSKVKVNRGNYDKYYAEASANLNLKTLEKAVAIECERLRRIKIIIKVDNNE